jgi:hypothetical protein
MAKMILIKQCADGHRWYADYVGEYFPYIPDPDEERCKEWRTREPAGYTNFIQFTDGELKDTE